LLTFKKGKMKMSEEGKVGRLASRAGREKAVDDATARTVGTYTRIMVGSLDEKLEAR
jgi:hypothetical protein